MTEQIRLRWAKDICLSCRKEFFNVFVYIGKENTVGSKMTCKAWCPACSRVGERD